MPGAMRLEDVVVDPPPEAWSDEPPPIVRRKPDRRWLIVAGFALTLVVLYIAGVNITNCDHDISRKASTRQELEILQIQIQMYHVRYDCLPPTMEALAAAMADRDAVAKDPWGQPYRYSSDGEFFSSIGADGVAGTEDDIRE